MKTFPPKNEDASLTAKGQKADRHVIKFNPQKIDFRPATLAGGKPIFDNSVWLRVPRDGFRCPITGLHHESFVELVLPCPSNDFNPPVEGRLLKCRTARHIDIKNDQLGINGLTQFHRFLAIARRGILLINRASLLKHLARPERDECYEDESNFYEIEAFNLPFGFFHLPEDRDFKQQLLDILDKRALERRRFLQGFVDARCVFQSMTSKAG